MKYSPNIELKKPNDRQTRNQVLHSLMEEINYLLLREMEINRRAVLETIKSIECTNDELSRKICTLDLSKILRNNYGTPNSN